jgi:single-stranded-DNA-specific exonuclease
LTMHWVDSPESTSPLLPGIHPLIAQALARRGISTPEAAQAFLDPASYSPTPATAMPGIVAAVERITTAIHTGERICVWGDFDADGQTATTLLVQTLRTLSADVIYHIPVRSREGHGISIPALEEVIAQGAQLILTCDTGITAHTAAEYTRSHGIDMIITDHHDLPLHTPYVRATVDPKMLPSGHPLSTLAGVGVAYKLAEELCLEFGKVDLPVDLLDLVALGMVADLAYLTGETRYLVQKGLAALRTTRRLGLLTLYELAELQPQSINESHIGFTLAPRLNSLGRLGDANPLVEFLLTEDRQRARVMATQLENYNAQRRLLTSQVTEAAEAFLRADPGLVAAPIIIIGHPSWPGGVLGIAAARLVERYGKPAIVFSTPPGEPAYGSARSVEGLHITQAIAAQSDLLLSFGGHPMAAGLSLKTETLPAFTNRMARTVERMLGATRHEEPSLAIDSWLPFSDLNLDLAVAIEQLAPFGPGNPKLILASRNLTLQNSDSIGRNKEHRKLTVADENGNTQQVMWWDGGSEEVPQGKFDLAYTLRASDWRGSLQLEMEFVSFRMVETEKVVVESRKVEVIDHRAEEDFQPILLAARELPSVILWAEGNEKARVGGKDRSEFSPADTLVIWTMPASPEELKAALDKVKPKTVWLVAAHPQPGMTENFMERLTGLLKHAITHRDGKVSYIQLAGATGQRLTTIRNGLAWLVARGTFGIKEEKNDELWLTAEGTGNDPSGAAILWLEIQSQLAETAAYRAHFKRAPKDSLIS